MATKQRTRVRPARSSPLPWIIAVVGGIGLALALTVGQGRQEPSHPEPRPDAAGMGESVTPASFFTANPRVVRAYQLARQIPGTLDGMYCYCHCKSHAGHRSLLTCFQSDHGAGCDICLGEAEMAAEMLAQGRNLSEIRAQVDVAFGR
jgi:hypothetical protein